MAKTLVCAVYTFTGCTDIDFALTTSPDVTCSCALGLSYLFFPMLLSSTAYPMEGRRGLERIPADIGQGCQFITALTYR